MSASAISRIIAILCLGLASAAFAATIDERVRAAHRHIEQGMRSGSINHQEGKRLAMEAILAKHAAGVPNCFVEVNGVHGGLVLYSPGASVPEVLYAARV